jgi:hypothetical protein
MIGNIGILDRIILVYRITGVKVSHLLDKVIGRFISVSVVRQSDWVETAVCPASSWCGKSCLRNPPEESGCLGIGSYVQEGGKERGMEGCSCFIM